MKTENLAKAFSFIIAIIFILGTESLRAQSQLSVMTGYKAIEISGAYTAENELIFGLAISAVDSKMTQKRANTNDKVSNHEFKSDYTPAAFGLIGAKFDELSIIGKIGGAYVDQMINGKPEPKNIYLAVGVIIDYKVSELTGVRLSYDAVSGPMAGISLNF